MANVEQGRLSDPFLQIQESLPVDEKPVGHFVDVGQAPSPARLEAFSDGVIAVIITVMVLNLRLPTHDGFWGLREILPAGAIYLLSFCFTGIYWLNHQQMTRRLSVAGYTFQLANLAFLFCLSLLPFSTYYLIGRHITAYGVQQYAATLLLVGSSFYLMRVTVHQHLSLHRRLSERDISARQKHRWSLALYLLCSLLAAFVPRFALGVLAVETAFWALPGLSFGVLRRPH